MTRVLQNFTGEIPGSLPSPKGQYPKTPDSFPPKFALRFLYFLQTKHCLQVVLLTYAGLYYMYFLGGVVA